MFEFNSSSNLNSKNYSNPQLCLKHDYGSEFKKKKKKKFIYANVQTVNIDMQIIVSMGIDIRFYVSTSASDL